jgi:predicted amidohydrolase YtcJ
VKSEDELARSATELLKIGFNMRIHCIGDAANRTAINAFERALEATGTDGKKARFAIEHCQVLTAEDVPRLAKLGIVASMQPLHATEDMHFAASKMGSERLKYAYIWRDLLDRGVVIATGTDYSVSPYNPFYTLHAAVTRQDRNNKPPGGWIPGQAMTREEAFRAATMGGAYVMFAEDILRSIEVGKLADFVIIPVDYMKRLGIRANSREIAMADGEGSFILREGEDTYGGIYRGKNELLSNRDKFKKSINDL